MSEQTSEALNFGPQWIRDLSNGANVSVPPPSPSYKLAQFRYGKEEMLALFSKNLKPPNINKDIGDFILKNEACSPLAMTPLSDEEQRNSFGSLNSTAVLKMMGRGGQRGGRGMSRGGRGSGRGRGEQGFYRGFSQDDSSSNKTEDGWQRDTLSRKHSWGENTGRGGFGDRTSARDTEVSPRGYESTSSSGRHSRALASGNWRVSEGDDDGGGWVTSRGSERSDRWRTSSRESWHRDDQPRDRRFSERNSFEDVPEWSKSDNVFEPDSGSFDATGAFCVAKDKKPPDDSGGGGGDAGKEDWDLEINQDEQNDESECDVTSKETDTPQTLTDPDHGDEQQSEPQEKTIGSSTDDNSQPVMEEKAAGIEPSHEVTPRKVHEIHAGVQQQDEVGANLERVAESCIANLDVEGEERAEEKLSTSLERQSVQRSMETKWFYRDPQGQEQGPFSNEEMVEWFHHGYFTMQLSVRRHCDAIYFTLGDLIKRWKRVPFMPGPSPPPITHQQVINEQTMFMQQQLLQQHYQHLQKQAILQQIQQQQQLQHEQRQQAAESSLQLNFPPENQPSRTVVSPRSLPTTTHSGSPVGAAEMIWGTEPQSPKGSWSPQGNTPSWNEPQRQTSPVPIEDIQKREREMEEEKERERLEMEKAERLKQEEEKRKLALKQEEERLKRLEEERREQEIQKAEEEKRKQEEAKKRANAAKEEQSASQNRGRGGMGRGKLYEMMEKEGRLGRKQRQEQDEERSKEESRKNGENEQRRKSQKSEGEKRKQDEAGKRGKAVEQNIKEQASKHQEDSQARLEEEWEQEEEMKEKSTRKRENNQQRKSKVNGSSRWVTSQNNAAMSLSEIQEQEEKNRMAHEEKMKELQAKQRQLQSSASHGWSSEKLQAPNNVKSLKTIQDEQARQTPKQNRQSPRTQPSQVSSAWNMAWTAGNNNVWTGNHNDREDEQETEYCDDVVTRVHSTGKNQSQALKNNVAKQQAKQSAPKPVSTGKKSGKKSSKEEESVRKIFQQAASKDPFTDWCTQSLHGLATNIDVPTVVALLKDVESPYEVHTYVREFFGDSNDAQSFAKEFIERRRNSEWKHVPTKTTSPPKQSTAGTVVARGGGGGPRGESDSSGGKTKKKKKQRMQKVDPSILGFSVNAAERVNMGEIQSVDDS